MPSAAVGLPPTWPSRRSSTARFSPSAVHTASTRCASAPLSPARSDISAATASGPTLASLSRARSSADARSPEAELGQHAVEHQSVADVDGEPLEAEGGQQVGDDQGHLDVGRVGRGADRVEVALEELAVATPLGVLAPPHRGQVVALERGADGSQVLGGEAGEGNGEVEAEGDVPAAVVGEAEQLLVGLLAALAHQHLGVLQRRGVDGDEAVAAVDGPGPLEQPLAGDGQRRGIVPEALQGAGLDEGCGHGGLMAVGGRA